MFYKFHFLEQTLQYHLMSVTLSLRFATSSLFRQSISVAQTHQVPSFVKMLVCCDIWTTNFQLRGLWPTTWSDHCFLYYAGYANLLLGNRSVTWGFGGGFSITTLGEGSTYGNLHASFHELHGLCLSKHELMGTSRNPVKRLCKSKLLLSIVNTKIAKYAQNPVLETIPYN